MSREITIEVPEEGPLPRDIEVMLYKFDRGGLLQLKRSSSPAMLAEWGLMIVLTVAGGVAFLLGRQHHTIGLMAVGVVAFGLFGVGATWLYPRQWLDDRRAIVLSPDGIFIPRQKPLYWSDIRAVGVWRRCGRRLVVLDVSALGFARVMGDAAQGIMSRDTREMLGPTLRVIRRRGGPGGLISNTETWLVMPEHLTMRVERQLQLLNALRQHVTGR